MTAVVQLPNGRTAHLKTGAAVEVLPGGRVINQVAAGGGTVKDLAAIGTASATATAALHKDVPLAAAGAAVASGTADLSTGAAAFRAAAFYYQLLGDCNV